MTNTGMRQVKWHVLAAVFLLGWGLLLPGEKKKEDSLASINREIREINGKLESLKQEKGSLLNEIYKIELHYEKEKIESNRVKLQLKWVREKIATKQAEKKKLELAIQKSNRNIKKIVRILYKIGGNTYLKLFIRIDNLDQLFKNYQLFATLVNKQMEELKRVRENMNRLDRVRDELQREHRRLSDYKKLKDQSMTRIAGLKRQKLNLINSINRDKKNYLKLLDELKYEAQSLNRMISGKASQKNFLIENIDNLKGKLIWPLEGAIVSPFGKRRSEKFDTYIINNGIEIKPSQSDRVKAIYSGEVIFADYFIGYGNLVIVQHTRDFYSMYGHCEKISKQVGAPVGTGEVIAIAGDTGSTYGKSLYLEIRKQLKALDPLQWLRKR